MEKGHILKDLMAFAYCVKGKSLTHLFCLATKTKFLSQDEKKTAHAPCCIGMTLLGL